MSEIRTSSSILKIIFSSHPQGSRVKIGLVTQVVQEEVSG